MLKEFRDFIASGNLVDFAVGIVIGAATTAVVNSLVDDIIMPIAGLATGGVDFKSFYVPLTQPRTPGTYATLEEFTKAGGAALGVGNLASAILSFLIVGFVLFLIVKGVNKMRRSGEVTLSEPTPSESLLAEIRDLLKR